MTEHATERGQAEFSPSLDLVRYDMWREIKVIAPQEHITAAIVAVIERVGQGTIEKKYDGNVLTLQRKKDETQLLPEVSRVLAKALARTLEVSVTPAPLGSPWNKRFGAAAPHGHTKPPTNPTGYDEPVDGTLL